MYKYNENTYPTYAAAKEQAVKDITDNQEDIVSVDDEAGILRTPSTVYIIEKV